MKTATTFDEQIAKLKSRGMIISDEAKAKENLEDIGYYRLGFYWFPFEEGYPSRKNRTHNFINSARFENAVALYYFDNDFRNILSKYLHRIEVNLRTKIIYLVSNRYHNNPTWFVDSKVMTATFIADFPKLYKDILRNGAIKAHHKKYPNDKYAPAWKTLEYMTLGGTLYLYDNLRAEDLQLQIAEKFNIKQIKVFQSQMQAVRIIRNICAHGHNLFDMKFPKPIRVGELKGLDAAQRSNISGGLVVIKTLLDVISTNRSNDFQDEVSRLLESSMFQPIHHLLEHISFKTNKEKKGIN